MYDVKDEVLFGGGGFFVWLGWWCVCTCRVSV